METDFTKVVPGEDEESECNQGAANRAFLMGSGIRPKDVFVGVKYLGTRQRSINRYTLKTKRRILPAILGREVGAKALDKYKEEIIQRGHEVRYKAIPEADEERWADHFILEARRLGLTVVDPPRT